MACRVTFPIFDNDGDLVAGAAALDSEISKDGGAFADCTNEATQIATASGMYYLDLTAAEMNADTVAIIVKTSTTDAKTTPILLYTTAGDIDNLDASVSSRATASLAAIAVWDAARSGHDNAGSFGEGVSAVKGNVTGTIGFLATTAKADVKAEVDAALVAINLDHLLAVDTPTLPGVAGSILQDLLEDDGGTWRFIANALEQAPTGTGTDFEVLKTGTVAASPTPTISPSRVKPVWPRMKI